METNPSVWRRNVLWVAAFLSTLPGWILGHAEKGYVGSARDASYFLLASSLFCVGVAVYGFFRQRGKLGRVIDSVLLAWGILIGLFGWASCVFSGCNPIDL